MSGEEEETGEESERERAREKNRKNRERVRLLYAGRVGGLNKVERGGFVLDARRGETDRGSRRAVEFTPCLEKAPSCLVPFLFLSSSLLPRPFSPLPFRSFFYIVVPLSTSLVLLVRASLHAPPILRPSSGTSSLSLLSLHLVLFVFARLVNASRPERTLHTQLFTGRLSPSPSIEGEGLFSPGTQENSSSNGETLQYGGCEGSFPLRAIRFTKKTSYRRLV